jgi:hypothetical protein
MTQQPRTIDRRQISAVVETAGVETTREVDAWLRDFLDLPATQR